MLLGGVATTDAEAAVTTPRQDLITTAGGLWLVLGLFADGWAHLNVPGLETFFTPWHAVLYSGFGVTAAWIAVLGWRNRRSRGGGRLSSVWPPGYGLAALGVALFGAGEWGTWSGTSSSASRSGSRLF